MKTYYLIFLLLASLSFLAFKPADTENVVAEKRQQEDKIKTLESEAPQGQSDAVLYLSVLAIGLAVFGLHRNRRKLSLKLTRWAKKNPIKAQSIIVAAQLPMMGIALLTGYNLNKMGYHFSDNLLYSATLGLALGFVLSPFMPLKKMVVLPSTFLRHKLGFLSIMLSGTLLLVGTGNRIEEKAPQSFLAKTIASVDNTIFEDGISELPVESGQGKALPKNKKVKKKKSWKRPLGAGACLGAVFIFIFLLLPMYCGGICLIAFAAAGEIGVAFILLGVLVLALAVYLTWLVFRWCGPREEDQMKITPEEDLLKRERQRESGKIALTVLLIALGVAALGFLIGGIVATIITGLFSFLIIIGIVLAGLIVLGFFSLYKSPKKKEPELKLSE